MGEAAGATRNRGASSVLLNCPGNERLDNYSLGN
jgi:hypothetical protein